MVDLLRLLGRAVKAALREDHDGNALAGIIIGGSLFYGVLTLMWIVYRLAILVKAHGS